MSECQLGGTARAGPMGWPDVGRNRLSGVGTVASNGQESMKTRRVYALALAVWLLFLLSAMGLGVMRQTVVEPVLGQQAAHVIGTVSLAALMLGIMALFVRHIGPGGTQRHLWIIGLSWLVLTVGFELLLFHFVAGVPWKVLLAEYNVLQGRVWLLVPATALLGPPLVGRLVHGKR